MTGADITDPDGLVEVVNPEAEITVVCARSKLIVEIYCRKSLGSKEESDQRSLIEDNRNNTLITLDTLYAGVDNVTFNVETEIISTTKAIENLVLSVKTTGTTTPVKALITALETSQEINERIIAQLKEIEQTKEAGKEKVSD